MIGRKRIGMALVLVVAIVTLTGASGDGCEPSESQIQTQKKLEDVNVMMTRQPTPTVQFSMDRWLLSERLTRFNDPNKMCYLYICTNDGTWLKVTVVGKVASTSKRLTQPEGYDYYNGSYYRTQLPDEMGTWGTSEPAKVGMSTLGSLLEFGGFMTYFLSEVPLTFEGLGKPMVSLRVEVPAEERAAFLARLDTLKKGAK